MSKALIQLHAKAVCASFAPRRSERGQGALEYMAIIVGLIIAVAILFAFFGDKILGEGKSNIDKVLSDPGHQTPK